MLPILFVIVRFFHVPIWKERLSLKLNVLSLVNLEALVATIFQFAAYFA